MNYRHLSPADINNFVMDKTLATVCGRIATNPSISDKSSWHFSRFSYSKPGTSFILQIDSIINDESVQELSGKIWMRIGGQASDLKLGDRVKIYCWLDRISGARNPGEFDFSLYCSTRNIFVSGYANSSGAVEVLSTDINLFSRFRALVTDFAKRQLTAFSPGDNKITSAIVLGDRKHLSPSLLHALRTTGLFHIISLSGLHLGIIAGLVFWLSRFFTSSKSIKAIITICFVTLYLFAIPARAPTIRAAVLCYCFCLSIVFRRRPSAINSLSLAAIILLLINPSDLFSASWQLSFFAVFGIILLSGKLSSFFNRIIPESFWLFLPQTLLGKIFHYLLKYIITMISVGFSAWLGIVGVLAYHFHTVSPFSVLWTMVVLPIAGAILILGFLKLLIGVFFPTLSIILAFCLAKLALAFEYITISLGSISPFISTGRISLWFIVSFYLLLLLLYIIPISRFFKIAFCSLVLISLLLLGRFHHQPSDQLEFTCLAVGHGQSIVLKLPSGEVLLFDAGSLTVSNVGEKTVLPFLRYSAIKKIDAAIISHGDIDHINGLCELSIADSIGNVYCGKTFFDSGDSPALYLKRFFYNHDIAIDSIDDFILSDDEVTITKLWPVEELLPDDLSRNDSSLVLLISYADRRILICSDIEQIAQAQIMALYPNLRVDIALASHHGSIMTNLPEFLNYLSPSIVIYSTGFRQFNNNRLIGLPDSAIGYYTPRDGAITITIDKDGLIKADTFLPR